ncbi:hypothetical protein F5882DRAFT_784 [Hyaloscypha sp. PMI_1271]|nr:hypothetical protein F5882DRAFT_784 [Hyaloscypha sp. PMI_1271]
MKRSVFWQLFLVLYTFSGFCQWDNEQRSLSRNSTSSFHQPAQQAPSIQVSTVDLWALTWAAFRGVLLSVNWYTFRTFLRFCCCRQRKVIPSPALDVTTIQAPWIIYASSFSVLTSSYLPIVSRYILQCQLHPLSHRHILQSNSSPDANLQRLPS